MRPMRTLAVITVVAGGLTGCVETESSEDGPEALAGPTTSEPWDRDP